MSDPAANAMSDQELPEIPDLELLRPIGQGGFGQVWLARNRTTGHLRAVKLIRWDRADNVDAASREISSLTRLESRLQAHPNLLTIHHVGRTREHLFYVMEPADDLSGAAAFEETGYTPATLESRLADGPLARADCVRYAGELLAGLAALHEAGMVHRDVKPANCLFVGGDLKLADFGLLTEASPLVSRVGTQRYMPPDGHMDARADVYAAGLVIYEMVTGLPAESFPRLGARANEVARDPQLRVLLHLVLQACQPQPQQRFADARLMLAELTSPRSVRRTHRSRLRRLLVALVVLVLLVAAGGWAWWARQLRLVHVNFVTYPFHATIVVDGVVLEDATGRPYTTPCTVDRLSAQVHRVVFQYEGRDDLDLGPIDFARQQEIVGRWAEEPEE